MANHKVVTHDEWLAVRKKHLAKEMDLVPKGRYEDEDGASSWVHRRDEYPD
jgi:predicted dithiol-disulfide oxidoreductase (DUF899 family)